MAEVRFLLNGAPHVAHDVDPNATLLEHLRIAGLTGTKEGCAEGECGACAVALVGRAPDGSVRYEAVNACLMLLAAVDGREVVSVEGVARGSELHPCQTEMARAGGSQCGYCTPGFVVSLFAEYYRAEAGPLDPESIGGNLCRCTGYRPIREAAERLATIRTKEIASDATDAHRARLAQPAPPIAALTLTSAENGAPARRFVRPTTLRDACRTRASEPGLTILSGGTDLVVEINQRHKRFAGFLSLEGVPELRVWRDDADALVIGAGVPLAEIEERLHHDTTLALPMLRELLPLFSSRLIRTRGTFGGNLGTASPIGDGPPALLGLGAEVVLASIAGDAVTRRTVPLASFFLDYRKTSLAPNELIAEVRIPKPFATTQRFYKVSKRKMDDISTVAAGFAMERDGRGVVTMLRLAFGGVAATPKRAIAAEALLVGKPITGELVSRARAEALRELNPIDDHRGTARYRRAMIDRLIQRFFDEQLAATSLGAPT